MKVADEIGSEESGQCCGIAKQPMERNIRKNDFGWEPRTFRRVCLKLFKAIHQESISHQDKECLNFFNIIIKPTNYL
jgi:hypothetical protein